MDVQQIVSLAGVLGFVGGFLHWALPDEPGIGMTQLLQRVVIGMLAGLLLGSPMLVAVMGTDISTSVGMLTFCSAALAVVGIGYAGLDITKILATPNPKTTIIKPSEDDTKTEKVAETEPSKETEKKTE